ncbi:hypothetical protein LBMAG27_18240 [Bacteroidota bacterium]|nr:hypothetical protein LBMAG27_18240 [Bacteroidota bacterium]
MTKFLKMKIRIVVFLLFLNSIYSNTQAQKSNEISVSFYPLFKNSVIDFNQPAFYQIGINDSIQFDLLRFYISGIQLLNDGKVMWEEQKSFHLIDANENLLSILIQPPLNISYTEIKFNLGIDSITNVSGAMGGDLDPTKGMYWTWQNGYINFKLEGKCSLCMTRNNEFQFHIGGYQFPFSSIQTINLLAEPQKNIYVDIDLRKLIELNDLVNENNIVAPSKEAVLFSNQIASVFSNRKK